MAKGLQKYKSETTTLMTLKFQVLKNDQIMA